MENQDDRREREFICHKITKKNIQNHTKYINSGRLPSEQYFVINGIKSCREVEKTKTGYFL